ncbi:hypothetical protein ACPFL9_15525 [Paenarthrobacter sp. NyZ202]|uniref:hypothetical protein n=1 Tax=Paenarthrobacter sp. NyZ202 TaxID=3402689 RepID=UPI003CF8BB2F
MPGIVPGPAIRVAGLRKTFGQREVLHGLDFGVERGSVFAGLALLSGTVALCAGALTGRKVHGLAAGAGVAVLGYVSNAVGRQAPDLEWLLDFSPYHWAYGNSPVTNGANAGAAAALWGISAILVVAAAVGLQRRDVGS